MASDTPLVNSWQSWQDHSQLKRLKHYAEYTDPALMVDPISGPTGNGISAASVTRDYQSLGAVLLNNLAAKMAGMLFPVNQPNFRIQISDAMMQSASNKKNWDPIQLQTAVATMERKACERLYLGNSYTKIQRAIKLCIVTGECLIYRDSVNGNIAVWNRHSYVVKRDPLGRVWKIILKQVFDPKSMPALLEGVDLGSKQKADKVELFTQVEFKDSPVEGAARISTITHEVDGKEIPNVSGVYPEHLCPMFLASWTVQDGEHYARGLVENFSGDFARLSALSHNIAMYEIDSMTALRLVSPAATNNLDDFVNARIGDYVPGNASNGPALTSFDPGDYNKINAINQSIAAISSRLAQAFMYGGMQRDSERTTATEVSLVAKEADQALGGAYSQLAQTLQGPLAYLTMSELGSDITSGLIGEHFRPSIVTGVQALARSADTQKLLELAQLAQTIPILTQIDTTLDAGKILSRIASNSGVSLDDFRKSPQQLQQEASAAQQQAQAQSAASTALINNAQQAQQGMNSGGM